MISAFLSILLFAIFSTTFAFPIRRSVPALPLSFIQSEELTPCQGLNLRPTFSKLANDAIAACIAHQAGATTFFWNATSRRYARGSTYAPQPGSCYTQCGWASAGTTVKHLWVLSGNFASVYYDVSHTLPDVSFAVTGPIYFANITVPGPRNVVHIYLSSGYVRWYQWSGSAWNFVNTLYMPHGTDFRPMRWSLESAIAVGNLTGVNSGVVAWQRDGLVFYSLDGLPGPSRSAGGCQTGTQEATISLVRSDNNNIEFWRFVGSPAWALQGILSVGPNAQRFECVPMGAELFMVTVQLTAAVVISCPNAQPVQGCTTLYTLDSGGIESDSALDRAGVVHLMKVLPSAGSTSTVEFYATVVPPAPTRSSSQSESHSRSKSHSHARSVSQTASHVGNHTTQSHSKSHRHNATISHSHSHGITPSHGVTQSQGITQSQSLSHSKSKSLSYGNTSSASQSPNRTQSQSPSQSKSSSMSGIPKESDGTSLEDFMIVTGDPVNDIALYFWFLMGVIFVLHLVYVMLYQKKDYDDLRFMYAFIALTVVVLLLLFGYNGEWIDEQTFDDWYYTGSVIYAGAVLTVWLIGWFALDYLKKMTPLMHGLAVWITSSVISGFLVLLYFQEWRDEIFENSEDKEFWTPDWYIPVAAFALALTFAFVAYFAWVKQPEPTWVGFHVALVFLLLTLISFFGSLIMIILAAADIKDNARGCDDWFCTLMLYGVLGLIGLVLIILAIGFCCWRCCGRRIMPFTGGVRKDSKAPLLDDGSDKNGGGGGYGTNQQRPSLQVGSVDTNVLLAAHRVEFLGFLEGDAGDLDGGAQALRQEIAEGSNAGGSSSNNNNDKKAKRKSMAVLQSANSKAQEILRRHAINLNEDLATAAKTLEERAQNLRGQAQLIRNAGAGNLAFDMIFIADDAAWAGWMQGRYGDYLATLVVV